MQYFVRDIMTAASTLDLASQDLDMIQQISITRQTRAKLASIVVAKGGVLKVKQYRELCSIRQKKKKKK